MHLLLGAEEQNVCLMVQAAPVASRSIITYVWSELGLVIGDTICMF